jgi:uncharacterized membrane protein
MINFFKTLQPIERIALGGVVLAAIVLICMGFIYPTAGVATLFMLGTLTAFWSIMTLIAAIARYTAKRKNPEYEHEDVRNHPHP